MHFLRVEKGAISACTLPAMLDIFQRVTHPVGTCYSGLVVCYQLFHKPWREVMITDLRTETPENGFRYTHDVLWHQKLVGQATEVRLLPRSREFTWFAFVEFNATTEARSAVATDDILETDHRWDPAADHSNSQECSIAAQYVLLRGQDRNGSFDLIKKESPDPIPGMQVPTPEDLRCLRESWPNVIAW